MPSVIIFRWIVWGCRARKWIQSDERFYVKKKNIKSHVQQFLYQQDNYWRIVLGFRNSTHFCILKWFMWIRRNRNSSSRILRWQILNHSSAHTNLTSWFDFYWNLTSFSEVFSSNNYHLVWSEINVIIFEGIKAIRSVFRFYIIWNISFSLRPLSSFGFVAHIFNRRSFLPL